MDPEIEAKLNTGIRYKGEYISGVEGAKILIHNQLEGIIYTASSQNMVTMDSSIYKLYVDGIKNPLVSLPQLTVFPDEDAYRQQDQQQDDASRYHQYVTYKLVVVLDGYLLHGVVVTSHLHTELLQLTEYLLASHHKLIVACDGLSVYQSRHGLPVVILKGALRGGVHPAGIYIDGVAHLKIMELDA